MKKKKARGDVEKMYPKTEFIKKLRRFADALETGRTFSIQIAGDKISARILFLDKLKFWKKK